MGGGPQSEPFRPYLIADEAANDSDKIIYTCPIQVESKALQKVVAKAGGNTLIALQVRKKKPILALAREIQRDVIRHNLLHVDFFQVVRQVLE